MFNGISFDTMIKFSKFNPKLNHNLVNLWTIFGEIGHCDSLSVNQPAESPLPILLSALELLLQSVGNHTRIEPDHGFHSERSD